MYDSSSSRKLTLSMEVHLAEYYRPLVSDQIDRSLAVELSLTQIQRGGVDFGLFAIAIAYDLASGNDPSQIFLRPKKNGRALCSLSGE